jgi:hypothetical protein
MSEGDWRKCEMCEATGVVGPDMCTSCGGYVGGLTQIHPEMVLAIPFFPIASQEVPSCVAYLPWSLIRRHSTGYRCQPAAFKAGVPLPRRDHRPFFDSQGLSLIERHDWSTLRIGSLHDVHANEYELAGPE